MKPAKKRRMNERARGRKQVQDAQKPKGPRQALLARVHIAKKALALDEETYRAALLNSYGVDSSSKLDLAQLEEWAKGLEREVRKKEGPRRRRPPYPGRPQNMGPMGPRGERIEAAADSRAAQLQKIEALLAHAGRPWEYADALAQRICKVEKIAWVETDQLYKVIAALQRDADRNDRLPEEHRYGRGWR